MQQLPLRISCALAATIASATFLRAQCLEFDDRFNLPGTDGEVRAMVRFDDGSGPAAYLGGAFTAAGDALARFVARCDGSHCSPLGSGPDGAVDALAVFDDGSGAALYVGGEFVNAGGNVVNYVAKWDGSTWSSLGSGLSGSVFALTVFDDGSGPALYAGGGFAAAASKTVNFVAKWDGSTWTALGSGVGGQVYALHAFDDGTGQALYAGGTFTNASGVSANRVAKWDGSSWSAMGTGVNSTVRALTAFDDGSGVALYAAGHFTTAGGASASRIAKWSGTSWSALAGGLNGTVLALSVFDDGAGVALYAGGEFFQSGATPVGHIARWNATAWSPLSGGANLGFVTSVRALFAIDLGAGRRLLAGGSFRKADDPPAQNVAQWDGATWSALSKGQGVSDRPGLHSSINSLAVFDDGSGKALYAGGTFRYAGSASANYIARWSGSGWSPLGTGMAESAMDEPAVNALAVFDDGTGPALFAGGDFRYAGSEYVLRVAKWDGANWTGLGSGTGANGFVYALCVYDDGSGSALYAGGALMINVGGGVTANRIAKWDGSTWSALGTGANRDVRALCVFDDGAGPALYAAGYFTTMGGASANGVAKWDGSTWSQVGGGVSGSVAPYSPYVTALTVHDDGSGAALYAGGNFLIAGSTSAARIAKWDGSSWSALGSGLEFGSPSFAAVSSLAAFDDGSGPALYAGGTFSIAGGVDAANVAKWDGSSWSALDGGLQGALFWLGVNAMAVFDDGADGAPDLYLGGHTMVAGTKPSAGLAEWHGCPPGVGYCFGDGLDRVVTSQCPCANYGAPGHGCGNSNGELGGARLSASGSKNPNTVLLSCTGIPNHNLCTFLRGTLDDGAGVSFGDGIRCASGTLLRFARQVSGEDANAPNAVIATPASVAPGNARYYQVQYRNPSAAFCPPEAFNVSNAYRIDW